MTVGLSRKTSGTGWALAVVLTLAGGARAASGAEPARWVASDAPIYLEVSRPAVVLDRLDAPAVQKFVGAVPAIAQFVKGDEYRKLLEVVDFLANQLSTSREDGLRKLSGGGVVFAAEAEQGEATRVILFVTPTDPAFLNRAVNTVIDAARKDAADKGRPDPVKEGQYRGLTGYAAGDGAFAVVGDALVIGNSGEAVKTVIDRSLDGPKAGKSLADADDWKAQRAQVAPDALAWAFLRLDRLRALDPGKFNVTETLTPPQTLLFRSWIEALRKASTVAASLTWNEERFGAELSMAMPGGLPESVKGFLPPKGAGAAPVLTPPGTIASLSLWRDLSALWEKRAELFAPEEMEGLDRLDAIAGRFFGGRDFGPKVLGALADHWRFVLADQDFKALKPVPDVKLPAFALVLDLKPDDDDFAPRLKVAFQMLVAWSNLQAIQSPSKMPLLELGTEKCEGVTITTARYLPSKKGDDPNRPVHPRHNFSPSAAFTDNQFILSSSVGLTRDLIKTLNAPAPKPKPQTDATLVMTLNGDALARLAELNRARMVLQNMLDKGNDKEKAEAEIGSTIELLKFLGNGRLSIEDKGDDSLLKLNFTLGAGK